MAQRGKLIVAILAGLIALGGLGWRFGGDIAVRLGLADEPFDPAETAGALALDWADLVPASPDGQKGFLLRDGSQPRGVVQHDELAPRPGLPASDAPSATVNPFNNGQRRIIDTFGLGNMKALQPRGLALREDLDGRKVRIAGFITPLGFDGARISEFLLVPYVGACIHVPPPAANQIIDVADFHGLKVDTGMLFPVWVTGTLVAKPVDTALANVGYRIVNARIERYEE